MKTETNNTTTTPAPKSPATPRPGTIDAADLSAPIVEIVLPGKILLAHCAAKEVGRYAMQGIALTVYEGALYAVATDGRMLAALCLGDPPAAGVFEVLQSAAGLGGEQPILIPRQAWIDVFERGARGDVRKIELYLEGDQLRIALFGGKTRQWVGKPLEGEFPLWRSLFDSAKTAGAKRFAMAPAVIGKAIRFFGSLTDNGVIFEPAEGATPLIMRRKASAEPERFHLAAVMPVTIS